MTQQSAEQKTILPVQLPEGAYEAWKLFTDGSRNFLNYDFVHGFPAEKKQFAQDIFVRACNIIRDELALGYVDPEFIYGSWPHKADVNDDTGLATLVSMTAREMSMGNNMWRPMTRVPDIGFVTELIEKVADGNICQWVSGLDADTLSGARELQWNVGGKRAYKEVIVASHDVATKFLVGEVHSFRDMNRYGAGAPEIVAIGSKRFESAVNTYLDPLDITLRDDTPEEIADSVRFIRAVRESMPERRVPVYFIIEDIGRTTDISAEIAMFFAHPELPVAVSAGLPPKRWDEANVRLLGTEPIQLALRNATTTLYGKLPLESVSKTFQADHTRLMQIIEHRLTPHMLAEETFDSMHRLHIRSWWALGGKL